MALVLIIEPDRKMASQMREALEALGHTVQHATDGVEGIELARLEAPDIAVLDEELPEVGARDVCRFLRQHPPTQQTFVLMQMRNPAESRQLEAFAAGTDDCVDRPVATRVLAARVQAMLRRGLRSAPHAVRGLVVDSRKHIAKLDGRVLRLTVSQFRLLEQLVKRPGRVYTRPELLRILQSTDGSASHRLVDVCVMRLRNALGRRADLIQTVRGVGYRLNDASGQEEDYTEAVAVRSDGTHVRTRVRTDVGPGSPDASPPRENARSTSTSGPGRTDEAPERFADSPRLPR